jgi:uncharacterized protein
MTARFFKKYSVQAVFFTNKKATFAPLITEGLESEMEKLREFSLPIKGLGIGEHRYSFRIDKDFFQHFEGSPIEEGNFDVSVVLDKRPDMLVLAFDFQGTIGAPCDRCLQHIQLPVEGNNQLFVKYSENTDPDNEEAEVAYVSPLSHELNIARFIYEYTCLAVPLSKIYDCENDPNAPCDESILDYLDELAEEAEQQEEEDETNPIWDVLKDFEQNSNDN